MLIIPGTLISLFTFPGVILHEYAHFRACRNRGIYVYDVKYFQLGNPPGYVNHGPVNDHADAFWIVTAPFFVNSFAAIAVVFFGLSINALLPEHAAFAGGIALWLSLSLGKHAFPSRTDASLLWRHTRKNWRQSIPAALSVPVVVLIHIGHYLSYAYLDILYAVGLVGIGLVIYTNSPLPLA